MLNSQINYSIIIPHKNIPELLKRCLDSIPHRDDVQVIVVDDNSDTDEVDFKKFPGLGDPHIEVVFTKEGKGAGYARNVGLTKAVGKWLLFADADDYFTDGFLECLDKYRDSDYDLIYFGICEIDAETKQKIALDKMYSNKMRDAIYNRKCDAYKYTVYGPVAKIIKQTLVKENNVLFDETIVANDTMASIKIAYYAKNVFFDEYKIYVREKRRFSLVSLHTLEADFVRFSVYVRLNVFLKSIGQKKYQRKDLISRLRHLVCLSDMSYFYKAITVMKKNEISFIGELFKYGLSIPYRVVRKIKKKMLDRAA